MCVCVYCEETFDIRLYLNGDIIAKLQINQVPSTHKYSPAAPSQVSLVDPFKCTADPELVSSLIGAFPVSGYFRCIPLPVLGACACPYSCGGMSDYIWRSRMAVHCVCA